MSADLQVLREDVENRAEGMLRWLHETQYPEREVEPAPVVAPYYRDGRPVHYSLAEYPRGSTIESQAPEQPAQLGAIARVLGRRCARCGVFAVLGDAVPHAAAACRADDEHEAFDPPLAIAARIQAMCRTGQAPAAGGRLTLRRPIVAEHIDPYQRPMRCFTPFQVACEAARHQAYVAAGPGSDEA